jgi:hypothetical protein
MTPTLDSLWAVRRSGSSSTPAFGHQRAYPPAAEQPKSGFCLQNHYKIDDDFDCSSLCRSGKITINLEMQA